MTTLTDGSPHHGRYLRVAVIIPALNESESIGRAIESATGADEIVVVDGGSDDDTCAVAAALGIHVIRTAPGRGRQLSAGVRGTRSSTLLFLHADTVLPVGYRDALDEALRAPSAVWGRFDVRFDRAGTTLRIIARLISLRSRLSRVATGDQAIFVRRSALESVGGIRELDLFEDLDLTRRLKRYGAMVVPRGYVITSSRRWRTQGIWVTTFTMWGLKLLYLCGVSPALLSRFYRATR